MSVNTRKQLAIEEDLGRGVWDWAVGIGSERALACRVVLVPLPAKGRFLVRAEAVDNTSLDRPYVLAKVEDQWPGPTAMTLVGLILVLTTRLDAELEAGDTILAALGV